jgi:transcriptional regulator with XRE-family HTH domain
VDRKELADFLKSRRERIQPQDVGLEAGPRSTPGLRREEVARLAGMSVDYYIRLEQARGPRPSRQILGALARALRLTDDEREYVYNLAGERSAPPPGPPQEVPAGILHLLDRLDDTPAFVLDAKYDVLSWNALAAALITDFSALAPIDRNSIRSRLRTRH